MLARREWGGDKEGVQVGCDRKPPKEVTTQSFRIPKRERVEDWRVCSVEGRVHVQQSSIT